MEQDKRQINGELFERLILSGAGRLQAKVDEVNDLNVFPIPDGDTGENMFLTIKGGVDSMTAEQNNTLTAKASALANGMLLNARGNSGVILSQLFFGLAEGLTGLETATIEQFEKGLAEGVKRAYSSVVKPVEGTMLTVAREAVEFTSDKVSENTDWLEFFRGFLAEMKKSLEHTPELLETLKEAGVIDSGGAGLVYIIEGCYKALKGEDFSGELAVTSNSSASVDFSKFNENSVMEFGYCTEILLQLQSSKTDVEKFSVDTIISFLETIGDSIVAFKVGTAIKMHVHTMTPYKVLEFCQQYGEYLSVKIENMTLQHNETVEEKEDEEEISFKVKRARRKFAVVTVASGEGLINVFKELGADVVISGGQTNNPSSEEFIKAFDEVNADYVFVLPNNSNIVMTAKQAGEMYKDSDIRVIESKNIGQGYSALSMIDLTIDDADKIEKQMKEDIKNVVTGMVSVAVRSTCVNGVEIKEGEYIGFTGHTMHVSTPSSTKTACELLEKIEIADKSFLILVCGKDCTEEQKAIVLDYMSENHPNIEVYDIDGGQDVYDFILIVE
ncbi:MAG: DAK2 domain-containing protein [Clostridia bacterium]|nr:DAK2 domain-containing protein [Clostridia bacterium]